MPGSRGVGDWALYQVGERRDTLEVPTPERGSRSRKSGSGGRCTAGCNETVKKGRPRSRDVDQEVERKKSPKENIKVNERELVSGGRGDGPVITGSGVCV